MAKVKVPNYEKLIESSFDIINKEGQRVPLLLNHVQKEYLHQLKEEYPTMQGIRENILKARQQGFSALIDAIFTIDFLLFPNIGALIISHKEKETETLIARVSFYIDSWCQKRGVKREDLLQSDAKGMLVNKLNGSYIQIGTAGARTLGRGGTIQNIHWSEVGFYPNTPNMDSEKLVSAAEQQVAMGIGKIFRESTGNMIGDYYHAECERARKGESAFRFHFFPWFSHPDYELVPESAFTPSEKELEMMQRYSLSEGQMLWYRRKAMEFKTNALFLREYPSTPEEAFLSSGAGFFDADVLKFYYDSVAEPIVTGALAMDGGFV